MDELTAQQQATLYTVEHPPMIGDTYTSVDVELAWLNGSVAGLTQAQQILNPVVS